MKKTVSVPYIDDSRTDASYTVRVDYADAIHRGARRIDAAKVYRVTSAELAQLGAGEIDGREADYSLWCAQTGRLVKRVSKAVRRAIA